MRRLAVAIAGLVLVLAACGGAKHAHLTPTDVLQHADPGDVVVSFCIASSFDHCHGDATPAQEDAVETRLKRGNCISEVVFVSKNVALGILERKNPSLASSPTGPPSLPDEVVAVPAKSSCGTSIAAGLEAAHLRGVAKVEVVRTLTQ